MNGLRIGITDCFNGDKLAQYTAWLQDAAPTADLVTLSHIADNAARVPELDALVLTGGGDVDPTTYDAASLRDRCRGIDERRDAFEFGVIDKALEADLPILGVCRGMQVMNVYLGGTLYADLPADGFQDHTAPAGEEPVRHLMSVVPHTLLHLLTGGATEIHTNSFHHQAVRRLGQALIPTAVTPDGVVEAAEWALKENMPFLMLVQWHPEREPTHVVSQNLVRLFMREVQHSVQHKTTT